MVFVNVKHPSLRLMGFLFFFFFFLKSQTCVVRAYVPDLCWYYAAAQNKSGRVQCFAQVTRWEDHEDQDGKTETNQRFISQ